MHLATPLATVLLGGLCLTLPDASGTSARRSGPAEPLTAAPLVAPVCDAGGPYVGECVNGVATVQLDGSASYDPAGRPLDFLWQVECMNAVLVNKNSPTPTLMFDLDGLCTAKCGRVDLFVRNTLGEFTRCSTQVTFEDSMAPSITCPPDVVLSTGDPTDPGSTGTASASDTCNPSPTITWSDSVSTGPGGETIITRTWFADDGCNKNSCDQTITIADPPEGAPGLDIKPTSCPNPINVGSNGVIPVALTGAVDFDVTLVDLSSLSLSRNDGVGGSIGPKANQYSVGDTATPFAGDLCDCHTLGGDGIDDLNMKFDKVATVAALQLAGVPNMTTIQLDLSGTLLDGTAFTVSDCIRVQ